MTTRDDNLPYGCTHQMIDDSARRDPYAYEIVIEQIVCDMKDYGRSSITGKDLLRYSLIEDMSDQIKLWAAFDPDAEGYWEEFQLNGHWHMLDVVLDILASKVNECL